MYEHLEFENPQSPPLCGVPNPKNGESCVLTIDHPGKWHMDGNDDEWFGAPSSVFGDD